VTDPFQSAFEFTVAPQPRRIWQVHDLVGRVRTHVEREYTDVYVEGEISNYRPAESGHLYFTLKDSAAQLRIVMFRNQARLMRFKPANGMQVIVRGRVTIYEDRGELQLMAEFMEPMGAGALQVAFEQLKARLAAEGLFDAARKKPLPPLPRSIGIVTSPRGAAVQDMLNVLRRRHDSVNVLIYPAQVQGESAPAEVSAGVRYFNVEMNVDVIIIARGGGSVEDLAAFNDEALARTIAASALPVISAVGHETDFTICDFVADLRAPTPSAAAEIVVRSKLELGEHVASLSTRLGRAVRFQIMSARQALNALAQHGAFARMSELIARRQQRVDELVYSLATAMRMALQSRHRRVDTATARVLHYDLRNQIQARERELDATTRGFVAVMRKLLLARRARLDQAASRLQALSPRAILERGYALVFDANGTLIKDAKQVSAGQQIRAHVAHGEIDATVTSARKADAS
jgi:exodeoxyribonuclease VII large subunit